MTCFLLSCMKTIKKTLPYLSPEVLKYAFYILINLVEKFIIHFYKYNIFFYSFLIKYLQMMEISKLITKNFL